MLSVLSRPSIQYRYGKESPVVELNLDAQTALESWMSAANWTSGNSFDTDRWYVFVDRFSHHHGTDVVDTDLIDHMVMTFCKLKDVDYPPDVVVDEIKDHARLARDILGFLRKTGR